MPQSNARFTMQEWTEADDCCLTISQPDIAQHRTSISGRWMLPTDVFDYVRIVPPISRFHIGDSVRIRPAQSGHTSSRYVGLTGVVTNLLSTGDARFHGIRMTYDTPPDIGGSTGEWTLSRVEVIGLAERVLTRSVQYTPPTGAPQRGLGEWEQELLNLVDAGVSPFPATDAMLLPVPYVDMGAWIPLSDAFARLANSATAASTATAQMRSSLSNDNGVSSLSYNITLTPQSEEDTQMNLADLTEELVEKYVSQQGRTANLLLDTKMSKSLGVDARAIKRALKKYVESLSWQERALSCDLSVTKQDGIIIIVGKNDGWDSTYVENLLPAVVPIKTVLLILKAALPEWVDLEANYVTGSIEATTTKGKAFAMTLEYEIGKNIGTFGVRGMEANRFSRALERSGSFQEVAARCVFNTMKQIAREAAPLKKLQKSSTGNFDKFMSTLRSERKSRDIILDRFEIPEHSMLSSRNWGIEVETAGARGVNTPAGWESKSDGSLESAYGDGDGEEYCDEDHNPQLYERVGGGRYIPNPDWTDPLECEACIANEQWNNGEYRDCREFVSPILHSFHSKGLAKLVDEILTQPQNDTAGIHVHVDVSDLTAKQIGSLTYGYQIIEPLIEASYHRDIREYCKARPNHEVLDVMRQVKESPSMQPRLISTDTRYVALNLESIRAHGTVEFRAMGPVYDYEYLIRWAYFCRELVNVAKANISQSEWNAVDSFEKLSALFISRGSESVDTQLSTITDRDIAEMISKNRYNVEEDVYATVGGEI